jgi:hypothetical protein
MQANESCVDRVAWFLNQGWLLWLLDDVRQGVLDHDLAAVVASLKQAFHVEALESIARARVRKMTGRIDELEVYLGYAVKLRGQLGLTTVVPDMQFDALASLSDDELNEALAQVEARTRDEFRRYLTLHEDWHEVLKRKSPDAYADAMKRLAGLAEQPLLRRTQAALAERGIDPEDADAQRNVQASIWQDMRFEVFTPLTDDVLGPLAATVQAPR